MSIERINPDGMYKPNRNIYSQVVKATGGTQVHVAGTVPFDENNQSVGLGDMKAQVQKILENIEVSLNAAGATRRDVVRINVFTVDVEAYVNEGVQEVIAFFDGHKPVSTTVQVPRLVVEDWLVEIEATAVID
ncbi:MAG: RidA family protein [Rhodospirillales bacterium]|nr:RidA family protein [Rhodospirillales bacterium]